MPKKLKERFGYTATEIESILAHIESYAAKKQKFYPPYTIVSGNNIMTITSLTGIYWVYISLTGEHHPQEITTYERGKLRLVTDEIFRKMKRIKEYGYT